LIACNVEAPGGKPPHADRVHWLFEFPGESPLRVGCAHQESACRDHYHLGAVATVAKDVTSLSLRGCGDGHESHQNDRQQDLDVHGLPPNAALT
jgi:hypothetical protein